MKIVKIAINRCYGGFTLSKEATEKYAELKGLKLTHYKQDLETKKYNKTIEEGIFVYSFTEDYGEVLDDIPEDAKWFSEYEIERDDPDLIKVIEELGEKANGNFSDIEIVDIPADIDWEIEEYDGQEWVSEVHRRW